jgi:hypothetical protein
MNLKVYRYSSQSRTTLGVLHINDKFECYTLEDRYREVKVKGETRIPKGTYKVGLRTIGGTHERYSKKFPSYHKGMLHVLDVPNFKYILIHIGNDESDTMGCLLVGDYANNNKLQKGQLTSSTNAYTKMYNKVIEAIQNNEEVTIEYIDL